MKKVFSLFLSLFLCAGITLLFLVAGLPLLPGDYLPGLLPLVLDPGAVRAAERWLYRSPFLLVGAELAAVPFFPVLGGMVPAVHVVYLGLCLVAGIVLRYGVSWREILRSRRWKICRCHTEWMTRHFVLLLLFLLSAVEPAAFPDGRDPSAAGYWIWFGLSALPLLSFGASYVHGVLRRRPAVLSYRRIHAALKQLQKRENDARSVSTDSDPAGSFVKVLTGSFVLILAGSMDFFDFVFFFVFLSRVGSCSMSMNSISWVVSFFLRNI